MDDTVLIEITMRIRPLEGALGGPGMLAVGNGLAQYVYNPASKRLYAADTKTLLGTTMTDPRAVAADADAAVLAIARRKYAERSGDERIVDGVFLPTFDDLQRRVVADAVAMTPRDPAPASVGAAAVLRRALQRDALEEFALECMVQPVTVPFIDLHGRHDVLPGTLKGVVSHSHRSLSEAGLTRWASDFGVREGGIGR